MKTFLKISAIRTRGFSLLELLTVLAIVGLLFALAGAAFINIAKASRITTSGNMVMDALAQARQRAVTQNSRVEVRFYEMPDGRGEAGYRAVRAMVIGRDGIATPLDKLQRFPEPVIISDLSQQNTIFAATTEEKEDVPDAPQTPYRAFSFLPNGQTDLDLNPGSKWYLTLYDSRQAATAPSNLPDNYAVIQLDAFTGNSRILRP